MQGSTPPRRSIACLAALVALALSAGAARADTAPPAVFGGHGVTFSYPLGWQHLDGSFQFEVGNALWSEFFAPPAGEPAPPSPEPPAPGTPTTPAPVPGLVYDVVAGRVTEPVDRRLR
jgi:hypothetical protein